jgi:hypothetical protein
VQVAFFPAEAAEASIEAWPGVPAAGEESEAVHTDREGFSVGIKAAWISSPCAPHIASPDRREMGSNLAQVIEDDRALDKIGAIRVCLLKQAEAAQCPGVKENVAIQAQHPVAVGFLEKPLARIGRPLHLPVQKVTGSAPIMAQALGFRTACIVNYQYLTIMKVMVETQGLNGKPDARGVLVGCHTNCERHLLFRFSGERVENFVKSCLAMGIAGKMNKPASLQDIDQAASLSSLPVQQDIPSVIEFLNGYLMAYQGFVDRRLLMPTAIVLMTKMVGFFEDWLQAARASPETAVVLLLLGSQAGLKSRQE